VTVELQRCRDIAENTINAIAKADRSLGSELLIPTRPSWRAASDLSLDFERLMPVSQVFSEAAKVPLRPIPPGHIIRHQPN